MWRWRWSAPGRRGAFWARTALRPITRRCATCAIWNRFTPTKEHTKFIPWRLENTSPGLTLLTSKIVREISHFATIFHLSFFVCHLLLTAGGGLGSMANDKRKMINGRLDGLVGAESKPVTPGRDRP